jgi:dTDP-glucose 4,6-dehydratase
MARERALVAGGAGFIGSHLCESLSEKFDVVALDSLVTGSRENLEGVQASLVVHDVARPFPESLGRFDCVLNLASPASPVDYRVLSVETLLAGALGTKNALDLAQKSGARFLQASTSEIYGDPLEHPQKETYWGNVNPMGERSCYDESKRFAEALCMAYLRKNGVPCVIARIFNTYGPRMRLSDGRVLPNLASQALRGEPMTVYGDGTQTRSFCHVSDTVRAIESLLLSGPAGEAFNVGNPEERTILEFARLVREAAGSASEIVFLPLPEDDPRRRKPDISKIRAATGWEPEVKLEDGIARTMEWFRQKVGE